MHLFCGDYGNQSCKEAAKHVIRVSSSTMAWKHPKNTNVVESMVKALARVVSSIQRGKLSLRCAWWEGSRRSYFARSGSVLGSEGLGCQPMDQSVLYGRLDVLIQIS
ncbi:hypothetical protein MTR67_028852 [Solanum verrucosum]|uniref:Uncharacterized protein n=1 Tax=Solanum verrucosum TaxID=315347 RepID=A0AAF0TW68_SOLVR|nr:hypothetical protein MTR67_028852 [Solanum verrucosum]